MHKEQSGFGAVMQLPLLLLGPDFRWRAAAPAPTASYVIPNTARLHDCLHKGSQNGVVQDNIN